jgi:fructokinase
MMILCCGEALIDMLPRETRDGERAFVPCVGGSVFNSAVALGRLGQPVAFFSGLSNDLFGGMLQKALRDSGVELAYARIADRPTTLAFVHLEAGQANYTFYDEATAGRMLTEEDMPRLAGDVTALLFGGISLAAEPCGSAYEALMSRESAARLVMLDPNIRPAFIKDSDAHKARTRRMAAMADIVKISEEDLAWLASAAPQSEAAEAMLGASTKLVVVTRGANGASAFWEGGSVTVEAAPVAVVDTIGAGDTFNAGLLAALGEAGRLTKEGLARLSEQDIREALSFACSAAAITVSRAGANPPWRDELPS